MENLIEYAKNGMLSGDLQAFSKLRQYLNQTNAHQLGLNDRILKMDKNITWDFERIYESADLHICLLMIPKGKKIPLHTHPNMNVLLKCLWGHFLISAYDWCEEYPFSGIAKQTVNKIVNGASPATLIQPKQNNIHQIIALEDCAFLEIVSPPYDEDTRKISYLKIKEEFTYQSQNYVRLEINQ